MSLFKRKKKICAGCGEEAYIYAKKMCQYCYGKKSYFTINKSKKKQQGNFGFNSEKEMFLYIWEHWPKFCEISKNDLSRFDSWKDGTPYEQSRFYSMFAHVLNKNQFSRYKLNPGNVILVHPDIHYLIDFGTQAQRDKTGFDFSPFYAKKDKLIKQYELDISHE